MFHPTKGLFKTWYRDPLPARIQHHKRRLEPLFRSVLVPTRGIVARPINLKFQSEDFRRALQKTENRGW